MSAQAQAFHFWVYRNTHSNVSHHVQSGLGNSFHLLLVDYGLIKEKQNALFIQNFGKKKVGVVDYTGKFAEFLKYYLFSV